MNRDSSYTYIALHVVWYFNNKTVYHIGCVIIFVTSKKRKCCNTGSGNIEK